MSSESATELDAYSEDRGRLEKPATREAWSARPEHPAIARLLDVGETERGEPCLVMGEAIDVYCQRRVP